MKKKIWIIFLSLAMTVCFALGLTACGETNVQSDVWTIERVYAQAQELGFEGSLEELIAEFKGEAGKDGVGVKRIYIDENGELVIELTEGEPINLGAVRGQDGKDGSDGVTPHIGENGNWWIGEQDTNIKAAGTDGKDGSDGQDGQDGADGKDGLTPHIGENGNWWIGEQDTNIKAAGTDGKDGLTPHIGENGNWWIGEQDTNIKAAGTDGKDGVNGQDGKDGQDGQDGKDGKDGVTPHIGENGNWWIGEQDTNIKAAGTDGKDGSDGQDGKDGQDGQDGKDGDSAFEIWKENYGTEDSTEEDFLAWLRGEREPEANLHYILNSSGESYTVVGIGNYESADLVIPAEYKNKPVTAVAPGAFENIYWLESVEFSVSMKTIGQKAFYGCSGLESVTFDENGHLASIGQEAFNLCTEIKSINIPDSVTSIGEWAFYGCDGLISVTIGSGVTSIGAYAFGACAGLTKVVISDLAAWYGIDFENSCANPLTYAHHLYLKESSEEITVLQIPTDVMVIKPYAFYGCAKLMSIDIPDSVTTIGASAFGDCAGLTKVVISDLAAWCNIDFEIDQELSDYLQYSSNPLTYAHHLYLKESSEEITVLQIPTDVMAIKPYAFMYCLGLTSIEIPDSVTTIGDRAFMYCKGLTSVTIGNGVTSIGAYVFLECNKLIEIWNYSRLPIKPGAGEYGEVARYAKHVYLGPEKGIQVQTEEGYIFYEEGEEHYLLGYVGDETALTLPEKSPTGSEYAIYQYAFYNICIELESVTLGSGVTSIEAWAFWCCSRLTSVTIGSGVTSIGAEAFAWCSGLKSVTIESGVTSIGQSAFAGCSGLTSIEIPKSVTEIGRGTFYGCTGLTSITIPDSVTSIAEGAFVGCSRLKTVYYKGTAEGWGSIYIKGDNDYLISATRYYFTEDEPTEEEWTAYDYYWHYDAETSLPTPWTKEEQ